MPNFTLLTPPSGNPKTKKGEKVGYQTYILHLAPAALSGHEVCRWRTKGCTALCLNTAGRGGLFKPGQTTNNIQEARKRKTKLFFDDRETFLALLVADIKHAIRYSERKGLIAVFRLNGTSDIVWENIHVGQHVNIFAAFPEAQFYDYTKAPYAFRCHDIPNYHLTFSWAETVANNLEACRWYARGHNVSVVFGRPIPDTFNGWPVFNADETDLRFLDPRGVAGLKAKGSRWKRSPNAFIN